MYPSNFFIFFRKNILEKPEDKEIVRESALQMVQCKVLKALELMEGRKFDDAEFQEDVEFLTKHLQNSVQDLRYCTSFYNPACTQECMSYLIFSFGTFFLNFGKFCSHFAVSCTNGKILHFKILPYQSFWRKKS